jgi:hypothetical protein
VGGGVYAEGDWIGAQPLRTLAARKLLEPVLRHEFLHALVEAQAGAGAPLWLREGLVEVWGNASAGHGARAELKLDEVDAALAHAASEAESERAHRAAAWYAQQTLSVAMIAMNEEANLPRTLESVRWADEIVLSIPARRTGQWKLPSPSARRPATTRSADTASRRMWRSICAPRTGFFCWTRTRCSRRNCRPRFARLLACAGREPEFQCLLDSAAESLLRPLDTAWRILSGPQAAPVSARVGAAERGRRPALDAAVRWAKGKLKGDMLHYAYPTMGIYLEHMNRYSSEIAQLLAGKGRPANLGGVFVERGGESGGDVCL